MVGKSVVRGRSVVSGKSVVNGRSLVVGKSVVGGKPVEVHGSSTMNVAVMSSGMAVVRSDGSVREVNSVVSFSNVGSVDNGECDVFMSGIVVVERSKSIDVIELLVVGSSVVFSLSVVMNEYIVDGVSSVPNNSVRFES